MGIPKMAAPLRGIGGGVQRSLLLFIALPLLLLAALGIRLGYDRANDFQQQLLKNDLELIARAIRLPVGEALAKGDDEAVRVALQSIFTIDRVYGASVFDRKGNHVASGGMAETDLTASTIPGVIEATGEKQESYRRVGGRLVFSHFLPLFDATGQSEGFIQITRRPGDFARPLWHLTWISWLLWGLLAITIVAIVVAGYRGGLGRYVDHLVEVMAGVRRGRWNRRATVDGPREVVEIARGLNSMLDSIVAYERELDARTRSERELLARLKDNEKMAEIGDMARGFAHELGAPLSVISGRARRLERRGLVERGGLYDLNEIRRQVEYLTEIVTQLLHFSRYGAGDRRKLRPDDLIDRVVGVHGSLEIAISVERSAPLPELTGDPERLHIALSCLLRNGLQAARTSVTVKSWQEAEWLHIVIEDDGPGLAGDDPEHLIKPFVTHRGAGEGTGLGLFIASRVAGEHGGRLVLSNRPAGGCRATLSLPVTIEEAL